MKFSIKDFFRCDQIRRKLRIWSRLLKKSLTENFIFYAVCPNLLVCLSHKVPVMFWYRSEVDNPFRYYLLAHWRAILVKIVRNTFSDSFLTHPFGLTVAQGSFNISFLSPSEHSTLLLFFDSMLTDFHNYVVFIGTYFFRLYLTLFFSKIVALFLCNFCTRSL